MASSLTLGMAVLVGLLVFAFPAGAQDSDSDGDGISDIIELFFGFDPQNPSDGDLDADGDGVSNLDEVMNETHPLNIDSDFDGIPDGEDFGADSDQDGLDDDLELLLGLDPNDGSDAVQDHDGDGLSTLTEVRIGTDPLRPDTDGDGVSDTGELAALSDPLVDSGPRLDDSCVATILNRVVNVSIDGIFGIPNVPIPQGAFRVRVVCEKERGTFEGVGPFVTGVAKPGVLACS